MIKIFETKSLEMTNKEVKIVKFKGKAFQWENE